jgi:pimeloyl-ACP methyl ester carboxylesterase
MPRLGLGFLALLLVAVAASRAPAQQQHSERVRLQTADSVHLRGTYYPPNRVKAPCVLLLHPLGSDSRQKPWRELAATLQRKGFAVLALDFRGHGQSTTVDPDEFWSGRYANNRAYVRGLGQSQISFHDFHKRYYPVLINDIAAARSYLDRKNDAREVNSSNLVVIGADTGATLGAVWLNAEMHRYRLVPSVILGCPPQPDKTPEGTRILAAIWLSIDRELGGSPINLTRVLDGAGRQAGIPMVFLYSEGNKHDEHIAKTCAQALIRDNRLAFTGATPVKDAAGGAGRDLLSPRLGLPKAIPDYLETLFLERGHEWLDRDERQALYAWRLFHPRPRLLPANSPGDRTLVYHSYQDFLR